MDGDNDIQSDDVDIEYIVIGPFKIWHIGGMVICFIMAIIVSVCCCKDIRIPRTKQEIEANHVRRKLHSKIPDRFFHLNTDGYRLFIDQIKTQKHTDKDKTRRNNVAYQSKTSNTCNHQASLETKIKWKAVTQSLKSISEEVPLVSTLATGLKENKGLKQQRPSQYNIASTFNSLGSNSQ